MKRILQLALLLVLVGGAVLLWMQLSPSPEKRVRKRMTELQELLSFRASDGNLAAVAGLRRLGFLFTEDAQVHVDVLGEPHLSLSGRDSIMQAAGGARQVSGTLNVEFLDVVVTLGADNRSAVVEATGKVRQAGSNERWIQELRLNFIETEEGWQISLVETVRTLTRNGAKNLRAARCPRAA